MPAERYWLECTRGNYEVLDRRQLSAVVARVDDPVDGERLVRLLNEDEKRKEPVMQELADQAQEMNLGY